MCCNSKRGSRRVRRWRGARKSAPEEVVGGARVWRRQQQRHKRLVPTRKDKDGAGGGLSAWRFHVRVASAPRLASRDGAFGRTRGTRPGEALPGASGPRKKKPKGHGWKPNAWRSRGDDIVGIAHSLAADCRSLFIRVGPMPPGVRETSAGVAPKRQRAHPPSKIATHAVENSDTRRRK